MLVLMAVCTEVLGNLHLLEAMIGRANWIMGVFPPQLPHTEGLTFGGNDFRLYNDECYYHRQQDTLLNVARHLIGRMSIKQKAPRRHIEFHSVLTSPPATSSSTRAF
jgi:hypothetical protein